MAQLLSRPSRTPTSQAPLIKGFSLLEILLVTGLMSVLGAIGLVNFADAQVRARVSRAKADMRTIATALELYFVDHNDLPPNPSVAAEVPRGAEKAKPLTGYNVTPFQITTPIAYLTSRPKDPFRQGRGPIYDFLLPRFEDQIPLYSYYKIIDQAEWWRLLNEGTFVSFIAVDSAAPAGAEPLVADGFAHGSDPGRPDPPPPDPPKPDAPEAPVAFEFANRGAFNKYGRWLQWAAGPDAVLWRSEDDFDIPGDPASSLKAPTDPPWGYSFDVPYDPTNGIASFGNISRASLPGKAAPLTHLRYGYEDAPGDGPPHPEDDPDATSPGQAGGVASAGETPDRGGGPPREGDAERSGAGDTPSGRSSDAPPATESAESLPVTDSPGEPASGREIAATARPSETLEGESALIAEFVLDRLREAPPPPTARNSGPPLSARSWALLLLILGIVLVLTYAIADPLRKREMKRIEERAELLELELEEAAATAAPRGESASEIQSFQTESPRADPRV